MREQGEPAYFKRRWVRCVQCTRSYGVRPPYKGTRSKCCDRPMRSNLWGGWRLRDVLHRTFVAEHEDRSRDRGPAMNRLPEMPQDRRSPGGQGSE